MIASQPIYQIAAGSYMVALALSFIPEKGRRFFWVFLIPALMCNAAAMALRYYQAWPMLPMHLGAVALPLFLGFLACFFIQEHRVSQYILAMAALASILAVCFPKDFYLPFLKSKTLFSHLFLLLGVAGKACFLVAAAWALAILFPGPSNSPFTLHSSQFTIHSSPFTIHSSPFTDPRPHRWTVWGIAFWTLSMFSGAVWSYLGWGTPVVWDDAAITTTMATWFFYICLLHLHLTGNWSPRARTVYAASGVLVVLIFTLIPDLGPFRRPF